MKEFLNTLSFIIENLHIFKVGNTDYTMPCAQFLAQNPIFRLTLHILGHLSFHK